MIICRTILLFTLLSNFACSQTLVWEKKDKKIVMEKVVELNKTVVETSGFIQLDSTFWTINDSGDASYIYQIDPNTGNVLNRVDIKGAKNKDWESLTTDDTHVYIGDFGNNRSDRNDLAIYRIEKSEVLKATKKINRFEKLTFSYPDNMPNHDCEAMIIFEGKIWLFTKNRSKLDTYIYTLPIGTGDHTAEYIGKFQADGLITAASLFKDDLMLLGYTNKPDYLPFVWKFKNFSKQKKNKLKGKGTLITPVLQFEAIITTGKDKYWLTCEGGKGGKKKPGIWALELGR